MNLGDEATELPEQPPHPRLVIVELVERSAETLLEDLEVKRDDRPRQVDVQDSQGRQSGLEQGLTGPGVKIEREFAQNLVRGVRPEDQAVGPSQSRQPEHSVERTLMFERVNAGGPGPESMLGRRRDPLRSHVQLAEGSVAHPRRTSSETGKSDFG